MSNDKDNNTPPDMAARTRRGSVTSAAFNNLFQRSNSTSSGTSVFPGPVTTAAMNDQRRRLSVTTGLGLSGTSPTSASSIGLRRGSMSTNNSDSIDENAIDEDDSARGGPNTPFTRRMSFGAQAMRTLRGPAPGGTSPQSATNGRAQPPPFQRRHSNNVRGSLPTPPNSAASSASTSWKSVTQASNANYPRAASDLSPPARTDQGFNWSEQLRSRAESSVASGPRPSFSLASGFNGSPPRGSASSASGAPATSSHHDRAKSVPDMPAPPAQAPKPRQDPRPKPDHFQERILKGDFYMD